MKTTRVVNGGYGNGKRHEGNDPEFRSEEDIFSLSWTNDDGKSEIVECKVRLSEFEVETFIDTGGEGFIKVCQN